MENKAKASTIIVIVLAIIVIAYLYSQGWFTTVSPYFENFTKIISNL
jgi:hypothetical protein